MRTYTKSCHHGIFLLLHGDLISEHMNLYGEWCEAEVALYSKLLLPSSHVVEIGAHVGVHTVPLAKMCPQGAVLCFEPQRILFQMLNANVAMNNLLNVHTRQQAVGANSGTLRIVGTDYSKPWNYGGFSIPSGFNAEEPFHGVVHDEIVTQQALDDLPELMDWTTLSLIKIDVEGAELSVLKGAEGIIRRHQPAIFAENNKPETGDSLIDMMHKLDYECYWFVTTRSRSANFNQAWWRVPGQDINMLCLPRGRGLPADLSLMPAKLFAELGSGVPVYE